MRQLLSTDETSLSPVTAVSAMMSVRNELQERVHAKRKIDGDEDHVATQRKWSRITGMLRLLAHCERRPATRNEAWRPSSDARTPTS